ncbi:hypothetical protein SPONN_2196 [uncultured Candidatus Thioglobus sp.]|nr:hypothetical protein SPONN_2196 [uncultured Candidatus Thioglobus sp.]
MNKSPNSKIEIPSLQYPLRSANLTPILATTTHFYLWIRQEKLGNNC